MNQTQKDFENIKIEDIKSRLMNGESMKHIAETLDVSVSAMYQLCYSHNIDVHEIYDLLRKQKASPAQIQLQEEK
jgi:hypothetical protein